MTVVAMPLVAENTIAPVSAVQGSLPARSDHPVQTSTTGSPSMKTLRAPPPKRRPGNSSANTLTTCAKCGRAAPDTPRGRPSPVTRSDAITELKLSVRQNPLAWNPGERVTKDSESQRGVQHHDR